MKKEVAALLGWETPNYIRREKEKRALARYEAELVADYYKINVEDLLNYSDDNVFVPEEPTEEITYTDNPECTRRNCETCTKCLHCKKNKEQIYIPYCSEVNDTWKNPNLPKIFNFDRNIVENVWGRKVENIRVIAMAGDKMDGGGYPFKNRDILLVDTSANDAAKTGAFLFTTRGGEGIFLCNLNQKLNGDIEFSYNNEGYNSNPLRTYSAEQLKELDFKIIGRVFKNESYNL